MSEKKFEECTLEDATHVAMNGVVYNVAGNIYRYNIGLRWVEEDAWIPEKLFPTLGIKTLKEVKTEPVVFEAVFAEYNGKWHPLYNLDDNYAYQNDKKVRFRCVEILEDEE